jgi:ABC-type phosphate/phosphonate transport system substrate-binding protein
MKRGVVGVCGLFCLLAGFSATAGELGVKEPVRVGMAETMVVDVAKSEIGVLQERFATLMKEFTGLNGQLEIGGGAFDLAKKLEAGKVQLAIFQGLEFAWVRSKHADFEPFMVALNQHKNIHAQIIVRKDGGVDDGGALKGKMVALPKKTKLHARLFLDKVIAKAGGKDAKSYFKEIVSPDYPAMALDALVAGKVDAVLADKVAVDHFESQKPGQFAKLKVLERSEPFPPAVVVYRRGTLDEALLDRFKKGMLRASKSERGQDLMAAWAITSFEVVPEDFLRTVEVIGKSYPPK